MDGHHFFGWGTLADGFRKGPWTPQEDKLLIEHVNLHGEGRWNSVSKLTGLRRSGKSCRLRWVNYLRPDLKRGKITPQEENIIVELHARWGNRWSTIARSLPGRTDNEIKNYWRTHFKQEKAMTKNVDRARRARFLRQQQEYLHLHHHLPPMQSESPVVLQAQQQQQQQQAEINVATLAHEIEEEMAFMYPMSYILRGGGEEEGSSEEPGWGSLWNLDDWPGGGGGEVGGGGGGGAAGVAVLSSSY